MEQCKGDNDHIDKIFAAKDASVAYCNAMPMLAGREGVRDFLGKNILGSSSLFYHFHKHKSIAVLSNGADGWSVMSGPTFVPYPHAFLDF